MRVQSITSNSYQKNKTKARSFKGSAILVKEGKIDVFRQQCGDFISNCKRDGIKLISLLPITTTNQKGNKAFEIILFEDFYDNLVKPLIEKYAKRKHFRTPIFKDSNATFEELEKEGRKLIGIEKTQRIERY